jgi:dihydropteroate synthase
MPHPRPIFDWQLRTRTLALGHHTLVMGILNVTPDSFSDGGLHYSPEHTTDRALAHALRMLDEGADLLDIGGESTRPNATPLPAAEEQSRVLPVIKAILAARPRTVLSIDTYHTSTARLAIEAGAEIVNEVSGGLWESAMHPACAEVGCAAVLMHTRGRPHEWSTLPPLGSKEAVYLVVSQLKLRLKSAIAAGIPREKIVLDPGLGFGKLGQANYALLAHLGQLHALNQPILIGASRKGFLRTQNPSTDELVVVTTAANVAAILAGAHIIRVHDVRPAIEAATVADRILSEILS